MKLWDKGLPIDQQIEAFTIGKDRTLDLLLARYDVLGSIAHSRMLQTIGLLTAQELQDLEQALRDIYTAVEAGNFLIEEGVEDVHSQVELMLTRRLGDTGKKVHSGRSRNDQVLLDLRLLIRQEIQHVTEETGRLFDTLLSLSEQYKDVLLPGYTHTQVAMPSSFGLWFAAYAESLSDDLLLLQAAYGMANQNPLGSGAGYGSSFPLDRSLTTRLLGFETLHYNVVCAQMSRGKVEKVVSFALASLAATLSRLAADVCLYMSQNFSFISFPDALTTGSSIMPHKKNPDVFELIRAKGNQLQALPYEISLIMTNLTSGYHRDLQVIKENFLPAFDTVRQLLSIADYSLPQIEVRKDILKDEKYRYLFTVETVNRQVMQGVPFRDAYQQVGAQIADGSYQPDRQLHHTHEGSLGNLSNEAIRRKMQQRLDAFPFEAAQQALQGLVGG